MVYAIIPAAGIGSRMQSSIPKQYLPLLNGNVLLYSIRALLALSEIRLVMIALHVDDVWWPQTYALLPPDERQRVQVCVGGSERWQSVQSALSALISTENSDNQIQAGSEDWVMVHDAVRPCVRRTDLRALISACTTGATDGALLATPVSDTLKKADTSLRITNTVDRSHLWAACTPQMFRIGVLQQALAQATAAGVTVTDEASAVEYIGGHPTLVPCTKDNIKVTYPEDLALVSWILKARLESESPTQ